MGSRRHDFTASQCRAAVRRAFPARALRRAVAAHGRPTRDRLWPQWLVRGALLAWYLQADWGLPAVPGRLRPFAPGGRAPPDPAVYAARRRLGSTPLGWLRRHRLRWLADPARDPAAFDRGRRLPGRDGTPLTAADTPADARAFGRAGDRHRPSGFPVVRVVAVCELGTPALVRRVARRYAAGERTPADRLLRHVPAGRRALGDRTSHSYRLWRRARRGRFDWLRRVPAGPKSPGQERRADGRSLREVRPGRDRRDRGGPPVPVRVIDYAVARAGAVTRGRRLTTLRSEAGGTARASAALCHRRWEQGAAFAEVKGERAGRGTHPRGAGPATAPRELDAPVRGRHVVRGLIPRTT